MRTEIERRIDVVAREERHQILKGRRPEDEGRNDDDDDDDRTGI